MHFEYAMFTYILHALHVGICYIACWYDVHVNWHVTECL